MPLQKKKQFRNILFVLIGSVMLITGITLVLIWWPQVVSLFKGFIGMALAVAGLGVLYFIKD